MNTVSLSYIQRRHASVAETAVIIRRCALIDPQDFRVALKRASEARKRSCHGGIKFAVRRRYMLENAEMTTDLLSATSSASTSPR
jgi:hypothetical protein